jgi:hypothetical protein
MCLEGWPQATAVQAASFESPASLRVAGLLTMRSGEFRPIGFMESIV